MFTLLRNHNTQYPSFAGFAYIGPAFLIVHHPVPIFERVAEKNFLRLVWFNIMFGNMQNIRIIPIESSSSMCSLSSRC